MNKHSHFWCITLYRPVMEKWSSSRKLVSKHYFDFKVIIFLFLFSLPLLPLSLPSLLSELSCQSCAGVEVDDEEAEQGVWQRCIPHRRLSCGHAERDMPPKMEGCWQSRAGTAEGKGSFINLPYYILCTCLFSPLIHFPLYSLFL